MKPIKRFGSATASKCWTASQNEPRFMAACRLSNVFSSDGSITASRFISTLGVRLICAYLRASSRNRHSFALACSCAHPGTAKGREIEKGNLSYLAIDERCARVNVKTEREHRK